MQAHPALENLALATAEISEKIERGKHTTRHVELFEIGEGADAGFLADTPGFSLLDFERFDFFGLSDLESTFRDFAPYIGGCRYSDCAHIGEGAAECAIARAAEEGNLSPSRLASYRSIYRVLKNKNEYYRDYNFMFVRNTENFSPSSPQDILNIFFLLK